MPEAQDNLLRRAANFIVVPHECHRRSRVFGMSLSYGKAQNNALDFASAAF